MRQLTTVALASLLVGCSSLPVSTRETTLSELTSPNRVVRVNPSSMDEAVESQSYDSRKFMARAIWITPGLLRWNQANPGILKIAPEESAKATLELTQNRTCFQIMIGIWEEEDAKLSDWSVTLQVGASEPSELKIAETSLQLQRGRLYLRSNYQHIRGQIYCTQERIASLPARLRIASKRHPEWTPIELSWLDRK